MALWASIVWVFHSLLTVLVFVLGSLFLLVIFFILTNFVNAPFYELIAEQTLILLKQKDNLPFSVQRFVKEWWRSIQIEWDKFIYFSVPSIVLLILSWLPGVGFVFAFAAFIFMAWYFGVNMLVYSSLLLGLNFGTTLEFAKTHKLLLLGFGVFSFLPILGQFLQSFQIVGGTLLYVENRN